MLIPPPATPIKIVLRTGGRPMNPLERETGNRKAHRERAGEPPVQTFTLRSVKDIHEERGTAMARSNFEGYWGSCLKRKADCNAEDYNERFTIARLAGSLVVHFDGDLSMSVAVVSGDDTTISFRRELDAGGYRIYTGDYSIQGRTKYIIGSHYPPVATTSDWTGSQPPPGGKPTE
jgi:hypothetical protein